MTWLSRWRNPQTWTLEFTIGALLIVLVGCVALLTPLQSDTWWLLRMGKDIVATHHIPVVDTYSYSIRGMDWPNHEWLSATFFYMLYRAGGTALLIFGAAIVINATWWLEIKLCQPKTLGAILLMLLGVMATFSSWSIRPQIITSFGVVLVIVTIRQRWRFIVLPIIFLVWANVHAGVASGGIVLLAATIAAWFTDQAHRWQWVATSFICAVVTLVNPLGIGLWHFILDSALFSTRAEIQEWQPPSLTRPLSYPFFLMIVIFGWHLWRNRRLPQTHFERTLLIASCIFAVLSLRSMRHGSLFPLTLLPLVIRHMPQTQSAPNLKTLQEGRIRQMLVLVCGVAAVGAAIYRLAQPITPLSSPIQTAIRTCPQPIYNTFNDGGFLIWFVPEVPVLLDNRYDPYPETLFDDVNRAEDLGEYRELFEQYAIQCAVVGPQTQLATALQRDGWREMQNDGRLSVWQR